MSIIIHGSKSYANRALILAALCPKPCFIKNIPNVTDVTVMIDCLEAIGLKVIRKNNEVIIENSFPECEGERDITLMTKDGGTTNRFLIALCSLGENEYTFIPEKRILQRPLKPLLEALSSLGAKYEVQEDNLKIKGPITISKVNIDTSETTQFATALKLIGCDVDFSSMPSSKKYFDMTESLIDNFSCDFTVPVDWSSCSYPLVFGALTKGVHIQNVLAPDAFQADSSILDIFKKAGIEFLIGNQGLHISPSKKTIGFRFDCAQAPDLAPALFFLASYCVGKSSFYNTQVLRIKESDREAELIKLLEAFSVKYEKQTNSVDIYQSDRVNDEVNLELPADHRIVMTALLFQKYNSGGIANNLQAIEKSFPDFENLLSTFN